MSASVDPLRSVRLSAPQVTYLIGAEYLGPDMRDIIVAKVSATAAGGTTLEIDRELAERFRSAFTDRLAAYGFDSTYQLTAEGAMLEALIDAFFGETD